MGCGQLRQYKIKLDIIRFSAWAVIAATLSMLGTSSSLAQRQIDLNATTTVEATERSLLNEIPRLIVASRCAAPCEYMRFRLFRQEYTYTIRYGFDEPVNAEDLSKTVGSFLGAAVPTSKFLYVSEPADLTFELIELIDVSLQESSTFCSLDRPVEAEIINSTIMLWFDYENGHVLAKCLSAAMYDIADFPELSFVATASQPFRSAFENVLQRTLLNIRALGKSRLTIEEFHKLLAAD